MRILFVSEFFPPFTPGGAEWSVSYLAKGLSRRRQQVFVLTPDYGSKKHEIDGKVNIYRFPFYKKIKKGDVFLSTMHFVNLFWLIYCAWQIFIFCKKNNIEIIHIHGKYSIPPAILANFFLRKKILATVRDYQVICNYGLCIYRKNKSCNFWEYFISDFFSYWRQYVVKKTLFNFLKNLTYASWGRLGRNFIKVFSQSILTVVLSRKQSDIFKANGYTKVRIIGNSIDFPNKVPKTQAQNSVIFAGRLTPGKGVDLLMKLVPDFFKIFPNFTFIFAGEGVLKEQLIKLSKEYKNLKVLGYQSHEDLLKIYKKSMLTVVPSVWPEPFGRTALESLSQGTPVVATNVGGLPNVVKDKTFGYIIEPQTSTLLKAIIHAVRNNNRLRKNIQSEYSTLKKEFGGDVGQKYVNLYKTL